MKWYVLQVMTGMEDQIRKQLAHKGIHASVPHEMRVLRSGGKWLQREYILIPSYVFVQIDYTAALFYVLKETSGIIKLLGNGGQPSPLSPNEEDWIITWENPLEPSTVRFVEMGGYQVISGPLTGQNIKILKIDRHRRRAKVEISILGKPKITYLSLEVLKEF
nr:transcription termination/antitermination NusG family protein [uncultured Caproiciproducens sp.]